MLLSEEKKTEVSEALAPLDVKQGMSLYKLMLGLTVRLEGANPSGTTFVGSGVIVGVQMPYTFIRTATHNIRVYSEEDEGEESNLKDLLASFKERVKVHLSPIWTADFAENRFLNQKKSADIHGVRFWGQDGTVTGYDACGLVIKDAVFTQNVLKILEKTQLPRAHSGGHKTALELLGEVDLRKLIRNQAPMSGYKLFQVGFGQTTKHGAVAAGGPLQSKLAEFISPDPSKAFITTKEEFTSALLLKAADTHSTWRGDSGGPLFAVRSPDKLYLLGVALGSNFYEDKVDDEGEIRNNAVTFLTAETALGQ